ncbi:MAG: FeoB-associated Cys-rich membrane protein [Lachnospira sp.]|nr:FeoB-associated Cys-rich membrane protein [Lachnospira sp.]
MKIIGGAIVLLIAVWLYVVSTKMINKDKKDSETGCCGSCSGCNNTECMSDKSKTRD